MGSRERGARLLGVVAGTVAVTASWFAIGWPAPAISVTFGLLVYWLARGSNGNDGHRV